MTSTNLEISETLEIHEFSEAPDSEIVVEHFDFEDIELVSEE